MAQRSDHNHQMIVEINQFPFQTLSEIKLKSRVNVIHRLIKGKLDPL